MSDDKKTNKERIELLEEKVRGLQHQIETIMTYLATGKN